jgi:hypothetical protein
MSHSLLYSPEFFRDDAARVQAQPYGGTRPSDLRSDAGLDAAGRRKPRPSPAPAALSHLERDDRRPPPAPSRPSIDMSYLQ